MFNLNDLLPYPKVFIQCHDNPDADALASAYAIRCWLEEKGRASEILYSGFSPVRKSGLVLMIEALKIPLRYVEKDADLSALAEELRGAILLTVDSQYGAGNVKKLPADAVAVIDHHARELDPPTLSDIRPFLGSCSTLIHALLKDVGYDANAHADVATALYYGLFTDTGGLSEIAHPLDMDMRDNLRFDTGLIRRLRNSNLSEEDLSVAARALNNRRVDADISSAVFEAEPCDPNILGFTSDLALQVAGIDTCVVFCATQGGFKLSVRSCVREVMASELAAKLCEGVGSGGGNREKAGGFIRAEGVLATGGTAMDFLRARFRDYHADSELFYAGDLSFDATLCPRYEKLPLSIGYVRSADICPAGTEWIVRTLEGDAQFVAGPDIYLMIGVRQEAWPIRREKFEASYTTPDAAYRPDPRFTTEKSYFPTVRDKVTGEQLSLLPHARACVPAGNVFVYIRELERRSKVFTSWNLDGYMFGDRGDKLAVRSDDLSDIYVIEKNIFALTYRKAEARDGSV